MYSTQHYAPYQIVVYSNIEIQNWIVFIKYFSNSQQNNSKSKLPNLHLNLYNMQSLTNLV